MARVEGCAWVPSAKTPISNHRMNLTAEQLRVAAAGYAGR